MLLLQTPGYCVSSFRRIQKNSVRLPGVAGNAPFNAKPFNLNEMCNKEPQAAEKVKMCIIWAVAGFYSQS